MLNKPCRVNLFLSKSAHGDATYSKSISILVCSIQKKTTTSLKYICIAGAWTPTAWYSYIPHLEVRAAPYHPDIHACLPNHTPHGGEKIKPTKVATYLSARTVEPDVFLPCHHHGKNPPIQSGHCHPGGIELYGESSSSSSSSS